MSPGSDAEHAKLQEEWLHERLRGVGPGHFEPGTRFCFVGDVQTPPEYADVWVNLEHVAGQRPNVPKILGSEENAAQSLLIFCDPCDEEKVQYMSSLVVALDSLGQNAPPMLWAPHTVAPRFRSREAKLLSGTYLAGIMELGLDGVVLGEPSGFALPLSVRATATVTSAWTQTLCSMVSRRRQRDQELAMLKETIDALLWDYLRVRLAPCVPPVNYDLPTNRVHIEGYTTGTLLGRGAYGSVYKLTHVATGRTEAVKVVEKEAIKELQELKYTKRMIDIMMMLSKEWKHENVTQLFEVYHSQTAIMYRLEFAGPENLFRRVAHRQRTDDKHRPITPEQVQSIVNQAVRSTVHLHTVPKICHRDIKPENFIVNDEPSGQEPITVKLTDFDLAVIVEPESLCRTPCGTLPFLAPEVVFQKTYDGMAADIWSLGIVLMEVLCGVRIIEQVFGLNTKAQSKDPSNPYDDTIIRRIHEGFSPEGEAERKLHSNCREELRHMLPVVSPIVRAMLNVNVPERWTAPQLSHLVNPPS